MSRHHTRLNARRWATVRRFVFERDGWRCVECGKAGRPECDHISPMQREPGQDPYDPNGLQTLCRGCHIEKTRAENRRPLTPAELAWRELSRDEAKQIGANVTGFFSILAEWSRFELRVPANDNSNELTPDDEGVRHDR